MAHRAIACHGQAIAFLATIGSQIGLIFEHDTVPGLVLVLHQALPPAVRSPAPLQQEPVPPRPGDPDLARLGAWRDALREAVEAFRKAGRHRYRQRHLFGGMRLLAPVRRQALPASQCLTLRRAMVGAASLGPPHPHRQ